MKKKNIIITCTAAILGLALVGGTVAAVNASTEDNDGATKANISVKNVEIEIDKAGEKYTGSEEFENLMPNQNIEIPIAAKNSSENGYSVYIKVDIYSGWQNSEGSYKESDDDYQDFIIDSLDEDWIVGMDTPDQLTLFYKEPLKPGESTSNFLDKISFSESLDNDFCDNTFSLEYEVSAVQSSNAKDAIASELGWYLEFDEEGNIVSASESRGEE